MFYILSKPGDWFWTRVKFLPKTFRESLRASRASDGGGCLPRGQRQLRVQSSVTAPPSVCALERCYCVFPSQTPPECRCFTEYIHLGGYISPA